MLLQLQTTVLVQLCSSIMVYSQKAWLTTGPDLSFDAVIASGCCLTTDACLIHDAVIILGSGCG